MTYITPLVIISRPPRLARASRERVSRLCVSPTQRQCQGSYDTPRDDTSSLPKLISNPCFAAFRESHAERAGFSNATTRSSPTSGQEMSSAYPVWCSENPGGAETSARFCRLCPRSAARRKTTRAVCRRRGSRSLASGGRASQDACVRMEANARARALVTARRRGFPPRPKRPARGLARAEVAHHALDWRRPRAGPKRPRSRRRARRFSVPRRTTARGPGPGVPRLGGERRDGLRARGARARAARPHREGPPRTPRAPRARRRRARRRRRPDAAARRTDRFARPFIQCRTARRRGESAVLATREPPP